MMILMREKLLDFLERDFSKDILELNEILRLKDESQLASEVPPNPFVGNPELLVPGECIAMFGINPAYRPNMKGFQETEIDIPTKSLDSWKASGDHEELIPWMRKIEDYFITDVYYGRYFTRLGNILGKTEFNTTWVNSQKGTGARMVFHKHVLKLDIIPYYSSKAKFSHNLLREAYKTHPALISYRAFVSDLLTITKPRWIFLNGNAPTELMESLFSTQPFEKINIGPTKRTEISVGEISLSRYKIPVLGVKFVNSINGPTSDEDWASIWPSWKKWYDERLE